MKRTALQWIMVAVLLVLGQAVQAQSAYDWIETHRKWMSEHYPKGEELSKEALLKEAAFAVLDGLREPEAKALLRVAEKWVPQLGAYLDWLESGQVDEKYAILLGTLKGGSRCGGRAAGAGTRSDRLVQIFVSQPAGEYGRRSEADGRTDRGVATGREAEAGP